MRVGKLRTAVCKAWQRTQQHREPSCSRPGPSRATYPIGVEQLYGAEHIKLPSHEELDGHVPRERGNVVLNCPLVNLFKKLLGGLFNKEDKE